MVAAKLALIVWSKWNQKVTYVSRIPLQAVGHELFEEFAKVALQRGRRVFGNKE